MKITLFYLALCLSRVLCEHSLKVRLPKNHQCIVNVSKSSIKEFNDSLHNEKKVVYFQINYDSKQADNLTKSISDDHFANPNKYMWLYDGDIGLPIYMNAPYDFNLLSLFILKEYTSTLQVNMSVSKSCNENIVSRVHFLRLVFHELIQIVSSAPLPDKKATAYICYDINNRKNLPEYSFMAYKRLGINRKILLRYCCKVTDYHTGYDKSIDLCKGKKKNMSKIIDFQNYVGAFLFAFFPLLIGFISMAKLPVSNEKFSYIRLICSDFQKGVEFVLPFGSEASWISAHNNPYIIQTFFKWLFLFTKASFFASRIRRCFTIFCFLVITLIDVFFHYYALHNEMRKYLENNVPLGYRALIFGYEKSAENTDYFLGGPLVWLLAFLILGLIVINIPNRLCETIVYSTLHQRETYTFLIQDIGLLQRYGSLKLSNIHDYDLLYAILKASLLTALNPSFWYAVIKQWFGRCKRIYNYFNRLQVIYQLMGVCVTFLCSFLSIFLCVSELLLCIIYYGCPTLVIWKAIPHSYFQLYISPLLGNNHSGHQIWGHLLYTIFFPCYLFLFLFSTHLFLSVFFTMSGYVTCTVIALIAKPDAIAYVLLVLVFFYFVVLILKSISETYQSLLKVSIKLADSVCKDFVYTRLDERFIYSELFEEIVERHHPIRYEVAKALTKLILVSLFFISCFYSFENISLNLSTYIKIGLIILTSMIPKITTVLNNTVLDSRWKIELILETIYEFWKKKRFPNNEQIVFM